MAIQNPLPPGLALIPYEQAVFNLPQAYINECVAAARSRSPQLFDSGWQIGDAQPSTRKAVITTLVGGIIFLLGVALLLVTHFYGINAIVGNITGIGGMVAGIIVFVIGRVNYGKLVWKQQVIPAATETYNNAILSRIKHYYLPALRPTGDLLAIDNQAERRVDVFWKQSNAKEGGYQYHRSPFSYHDPSDRDATLESFKLSNSRIFVTQERFDEKVAELKTLQTRLGQGIPIPIAFAAAKTLGMLFEGGLESIPSFMQKLQKWPTPEQMEGPRMKGVMQGISFIALRMTVLSSPDEQQKSSTHAKYAPQQVVYILYSARNDLSWVPLTDQGSIYPKFHADLSDGQITNERGEKANPEAFKLLQNLLQSDFGWGKDANGIGWSNR